jgi:adenosylcobyric acid synthase
VLQSAGFDVDIAAHVRRGGHVLGICGGYQMLGRTIADPQGSEGAPGKAKGLGLLDVATVLGGDKTLSPASGHTADGTRLRGYEMHIGQTTCAATVPSFARFDDGRSDGAMSSDGRIVGTYLHGLFSDDVQRARWLEKLGGTSQVANHDANVDAVLDGLAAHLERHLDPDALLSHAR